MYKVILILLATLCSTGCVTNESYKETASLIKVENPRSLEIVEPLVMLKKSKDDDEEDFTQGLLPGRYTSLFENSLGVFYHGEGRVYFFRDVLRSTYYVRKGGIWIPKSPLESPKIFYVVDSEDGIVTAVTLEDAMKSNTATNSSGGSAIYHNYATSNLAKDIGYGLGTGIVKEIASAEVGRSVIVATDSENDFAAKLDKIVEPFRDQNPQKASNKSSHSQP